jgi:glycosyltransferase involved in cell wall biosynthesis
MNGRRRLLFLSQTLPYPPHGGVQIRTFHTLRNLAKVFDVTALCFYRWKTGHLEPDVDQALRVLGKFARVEAFPIPQEHGRLRVLLDHASSAITGRVYTVSTYRSRAFEDAIKSARQRTEFDIAHLDSLDLSGYLPLLEDLPTVCVHHDAQSLLLRRRARHQKSRLMAAYLNYQSRLMEKEEREICPSVDLNVTVSEADRTVLRGIAPNGRFEVVPNGVDIDYFKPDTEPAEGGIVFVGGTTWYPNKDALEYYRSTILPELRATLPFETTMWVGRATDDEIGAFSCTGLELTGYVEDVRPFIANAACYVVPIRVGGGTRIKILDAWAMGKAVVSTSVGCEGLDAKHGENILIADDPGEFALRVREVIEDPQLRRSLGINARKTAERKYSWEAIGHDMTRMYSELLRD